MLKSKVQKIEKRLNMNDDAPVGIPIQWFGDRYNEFFISREAEDKFVEDMTRAIKNIPTPLRPTPSLMFLYYEDRVRELIKRLKLDSTRYLKNP